MLRFVWMAILVCGLGVVAVTALLGESFASAPSAAAGGASPHVGLILLFFVGILTVIAGIIGNVALTARQGRLV